MIARKFSIFAFALLAGCSSLTDLKQDISERMFGAEPANPPTPLTEIKPTMTAKIVWSASVAKAEGYSYTPAVDGSAVFVASANGDITRFDLANGKQVWRINADETISGGVGAGENLVLVGSNEGMVLAFDQNGKALWKAKVSSEVLSAPKISGGVVVVRSGDSRIYGLNATDGKRKWVYERATPSLALRSNAGVTLADGAAYVGFAGGKMVAIKADDGRLLWEASVALPKGVTEIERIADITSLPVVEGRMVYAAAFQGRVAAVDRTNGRVMWTHDLSSYNGLGTDYSRLYAAGGDGAVWSLDNGSGKSYWKQEKLRYRQISAPVPVGGSIAVGDLEGYVHFLSADDGSFVARIQTNNSPVMAQPVALGDYRLLVQTAGGGVYVISLK
ncbi:MAG: outer membrane protein assembly factor BamB [Methylobacillus sp.]|jgi:outer membrane protein assembly factor BamB|nr:outer membrane protein assembly factor BamB [Methylobacillus sp.]